MAIRPLFVSTSPLRQTDDVIDDRSNNYPSIIKDSNGRSVMFYEKRLKTGRTSDGGITFTSPSLDCTVPAGDGGIDGVSITWDATVLTLPPNSYILIYVTAGGVVGATDDFPVSFTKDVIILAFAYVGETSIVRIIEMEKDGYYIYYKRQILSGSEYVWDDYEYKLNVGEKPSTFYDFTNDMIYMSCQKDGASMVREFDLSNPNTWEDINHVLLVDPILYPVPQPNAEVLITSGCSNSTIKDTSPPLYDFSSEIYVGLKIGSNEPYLYIPYVSSSFNDYATFPATMNVFSKSGSIYTLEDQFLAYPIEKYQGLSQIWSHSRGNKYAGLIVDNILFTGAYETDPKDYALIHIPDNIDETEEIDSTNLSTTIYPEVWDVSVGYSKSFLTKTEEYDQLFRYPEDSVSNVEVGYSKAFLTKTEEYDQLFTFPEDSVSNVEVAYGKASHSIVNT